MGAWLETPRGNDTALDYEDNIFNPQDEDEQRYVAWLLTQLHPSFPRLKAHVDNSLKQMRALLDKGEWISRWDDPDKVVASIRQQIKDLENVV